MNLYGSKLKRREKMKKLIIFLVFIASTNAQSANFTKAGSVADLLVTTVGTSDMAIMYLDGFSSAGNCAVSSSKNLVILTLPDSEKGKLMFSMALSAFVAGQPIKIILDDSNQDSNGYCRVEWLRLNTDF